MPTPAVAGPVLAAAGPLKGSPARRFACAGSRGDSPPPLRADPSTAGFQSVREPGRRVVDAGE